MTKIIVSLWIYFASLIALVCTAGLISRLLALYPHTHLASFGPLVPGIARIHASWLPSAPTALFAVAAITVGIGLYLWRSRQGVETTTFLLAVISALNYFAALFCLATLVVAYFYLPKAANMA